MENTFMTHEETVALLRRAMRAQGRSTKAIAENIGVRPNTLYKWLSGAIELSHRKTDRLLRYLMENEPERLRAAACGQSDILYQL